MEQFRDIPGYRGRFSITCDGTVRVNPYTTAKNAHRPARILQQALTANGYATVRLRLGGKARKRMVHRLVLETYFGPCPDGMEACHNDGDKTNNHIDNLRWDTHSQNCYDKVAHGTEFQSSKTHCPQGHPLSGENVYNPPRNRNWRMCRTCMRKHQRAYYRRHR